MMEPLREALDAAYERGRADARNEHGCLLGCSSGACETCPCCCAGWCVYGLDGLPDAPDDFDRWLEVAAEHNPVAARLRDEYFHGEPIVRDLLAENRAMRAKAAAADNVVAKVEEFIEAAERGHVLIRRSDLKHLIRQYMARVRGEHGITS